MDQTGLSSDGVSGTHGTQCLTFYSWLVFIVFKFISHSFYLKLGNVEVKEGDVL